MDKGTFDPVQRDNDWYMHAFPDTLSWGLQVRTISRIKARTALDPEERDDGWCMRARIDWYIFFWQGKKGNALGGVRPQNEELRGNLAEVEKQVDGERGAHAALWEKLQQANEKLSASSTEAVAKENEFERRLGLSDYRRQCTEAQLREALANLKVIFFPALSDYPPYLDT